MEEKSRVVFGKAATAFCRRGPASGINDSRREELWKFTVFRQNFERSQLITAQPAALLRPARWLLTFPIPVWERGWSDVSASRRRQRPALGELQASPLFRLSWQFVF